GYYTQGKNDGKLRTLKVGSAAAGLTLHYRKGFFAEPAEPPKGVNKEALLRDAIANPLPATEMQLRVRLVAVHHKPDVKCFVAQNAIMFTPGDNDSKHCELALAVAFVSDTGEIQHVDEKAASMNFDSGKMAAIMKAGLGFRLEIQQPKHGMNLRI